MEDRLVRLETVMKTLLIICVAVFTLSAIGRLLKPHQERIESSIKTGTTIATVSVAFLLAVMWMISAIFLVLLF